MFLPTTQDELKELGWTQLDIIFVTGDAYIDSPYIGVSVLGQLLLENGFKVGIIAQPDINSTLDINRLGEPKLFWGVTAGSIDSSVANYTALKKFRKFDDFTPGGINNKRPNRATIAYTNLIKQNFKNTVPIILGGIEASLRRISHYDFLDGKIRNSILVDSKADFLVYGMAEKTILEISQKLKFGGNIKNIKGLCYLNNDFPNDYIELEDSSIVKSSKIDFKNMFMKFYYNCDPKTAIGLYQKYNKRYLICNPPNSHLSQINLDKIYELDYMYDVHPYYKKQGKVKAIDTIDFSITTHRGCYGECNFCAIAVHQGKKIEERSQKSIIKEATRLSKLPNFKGYIKDVGGPTANMLYIECEKKKKLGSCKPDENGLNRCLFPTICDSLKVSHEKQIELLSKIEKIDGIKKVFIASGIRYDMIEHDKNFGNKYLKKIITDHTSGQLKIAPEHTNSHVLNYMGKPENDSLVDFKDKFYAMNKKLDLKQFLTYYFIAAHPGCAQKNMMNLKNYLLKNFKTLPEQIQIFTPTPSTISTLMYYLEEDPYTNKKLFVEKDNHKKMIQKDSILNKKPNAKK